MNTIDTFIEKYDDLIKESSGKNLINEDIENVLCDLLYINSKYLNDDCGIFTKRFHTNLRQIDCTSSGRMDMALYRLMHQAKLFWEVFEKVVKE